MLIVKNIFAQGLGIIIALGFMTISARMMTIKEYGELRYIMTLLPLLMVITIPGFDSIILRISSMKKPVPLWNIFLARVAFGCIGSIAVVIWVNFSSNNTSEELLFFLWATAFALPLFETATGHKNYLFGCGLKHQAIKLIVNTRIYTLIVLSIFAVCIYFYGYPAIYLYPSWLIAVIAPTIYAFCKVTFVKRNTSFYTNRVVRGDKHFTEAVSASLASLIYTSIFSFDKIYVRSSLGPEMLAYYSMLVIIPQEISKLLDSTLPIYYRKIFFSDIDVISYGKNKTFFILVILFLVMMLYSLLFFIGAPWVFGSEYSYPLKLVFLSSVLIPSLLTESFFNNKIFADDGARLLVIYHVMNLIMTASFVIAGISLFELKGLMAFLVIKQFSFPFMFYKGKKIIKKIRHDLS